MKLGERMPKVLDGAAIAAEINRLGIEVISWKQFQKITETAAQKAARP